MAALPANIRISCPVCADPVALPLKAGPNKIQGQRLVVDLSADDAPLRKHLQEQHDIDEATKPPKAASIALAGNPQTAASVSFNVRPAAPAADTAGVARDVARLAHMQQLGRR